MIWLVTPLVFFGVLGAMGVLGALITTGPRMLPGDIRRCAACHLALDPTDGPTCHVCDVHAYQAWVRSLPVTEPTR
jgi:uncharacterized paraquat-inducible protein A